jgi:hypothetical protein
MKKIIALFLLLSLTGAAFAGGKKDDKSTGAGEPTKAVEQAKPAPQPVPPRNLGQGIRLAVLMPEGRNFTEGDAWLLASARNRFMDSFKKYLQMTIIDRQNLDTVLDEQKRSASGAYSEEDYIGMGRMVNAQYILAGSIIKIPGG